MYKEVEVGAGEQEPTVCHEVEEDTEFSKVAVEPMNDTGRDCVPTIGDEHGPPFEFVCYDQE